MPVVPSVDATEGAAPTAATSPVAEVIADSSTPQVLYFKVVNPTPSRAKTVALPPGAGSKLRHNDILVTLHRSTAGGAVEAGPSILAGVAIFVVLRLGANFQTFRNGFVQWPIDGTSVYGVVGYEHDENMVALITNMVRLRALHGHDGVLAVPDDDYETTSMLGHLGGAGLVNQTTSMTLLPHGCRGWILTQSGLQLLTHAHRLRAPIPVCSSGSGLALEECSVLQLMLRLENDGWEMKRTSPAKAFKAFRLRKPFESAFFLCVCVCVHVHNLHIFMVFVFNWSFCGNNIQTLFCCSELRFYLLWIRGVVLRSWSSTSVVDCWKVDTSTISAVSFGS